MTNGRDATAHVSSTYDPANASITIRLLAHDDLEAGWQLAFTSIVQIDPDPSVATLTERVSSFHVVAPRDGAALTAGEVWELPSVALSHPPHHANDGPVSAYLVLAGSEIVTVDVTWLALADTAATPPTTPPARTDVPSLVSPPLVPYPARIVVDDPTTGPCTRLRLATGPDAAVEAWSAVGALAARMLERSVLEPAGAADSDDPALANVIALAAAELPDEAYEMRVSGSTVEVSASGVAGFRLGFVTLAQWATTGLAVAASVHDRPRFSWRGVHLDVARQWYEPDRVAHIIDVAAWHKMSRLHLHLTDDEGWRLPVARRPWLGAVGGVRGHGLALPPMYGGGPEPTGRAYTPDEIAEWCSRAHGLGVVIVPEIDLPAHMHAALCAEPALRDPDDRSGAVSVQYYVDNVLVPGHGTTMEFVTDVFDSVAELFPHSPWIHIGGDEVPPASWSGSPIAEGYRAERNLESVADVEAEFLRDVVAHISERHARRVGAWQEAAECGGVRPEDGYVVGWRTADASRSLAARGYDVVVAPGQAYYLDMATSEAWDAVGACWAGTTSFDSVCEFDPAGGWSADELAHLVGIQACLWSEHVRDDATFEHLMFPRLLAVAERAWTGEIAGGAASLRHRCATLGFGTRPRASIA